MIIKPSLDQQKSQTRNLAPGFARMFERFGYVFEPVDAPGGGADGRVT